MGKKNRHKLNLRPTGDKQPAPEAQQSKTEQAIRDLAHELYEQRGGKAIDAAVKRMERLLELHDREAAKLMTSEVANHRWQVSPSMVIRLQREAEREEERRQALREECWAMARKMVLQWLGEQAAQEQQRPEQQSAEQPATHQPIPVKGAVTPATKGGDADALSRAG